jgi:hypothetical protein
VPWPPPYFLSARQALEHYKSPSNLQMFTYVLMIDALGYKSWMKPLDACQFLVQILTLNRYRSRIEYLCLAMLRPVEVGWCPVTCEI